MQCDGTPIPAPTLSLKGRELERCAFEALALEGEYAGTLRF
jgi:hypothetical protein